jgi:GT2 family glycosyltransferase
MNIVGIVLSYNVPEATDRLVANLQEKCQSDWPLIVVDNGSDPDKISRHTTDRVLRNNRMTGGFNYGLQVAQRQHPSADAYWFFTHDCYFVSDQCPLKNSCDWLSRYPDIGILHPSEDHRVKCCFDVHHNVRGGLKIAAMFDFVCPLFTREAIDAIGGSFNSELYYGWGLDFESSYLARRAGLRVAMNHDLVVMHDTSTTYDLGRDAECQNRQAFYDRALNNMRNVLGAKYGPDWETQFYAQYAEEVGKWRT